MPNIANSGSFQPATMFKPNRPPLMWSMVAASLATRSGRAVGTWIVAIGCNRSVTAAIAAAQVNVSNDRSLKLVDPPAPFQRATGTNASSPAATAALAMRPDSAQDTWIVPDARVLGQAPA